MSGLHAEEVMKWRRHAWRFPGVPTTSLFYFYPINFLKDHFHGLIFVSCFCFIILGFHLFSSEEEDVEYIQIDSVSWVVHIVIMFVHVTSILDYAEIEFVIILFYLHIYRYMTKIEIL